MVDLYDYWTVTQLSQLKGWFIPSTDKLWINIERCSSSIFSLNSLLLTNIWKPRPFKTVTLSTQASLMVWRTLNSTHLPQSQKISTPTSLKTFEMLIPNVSLYDWEQKGITSIGHMFKERTLKSFLSLQTYLPLIITYTSEYLTS